MSLAFRPHRAAASAAALCVCAAACTALCPEGAGAQGAGPYAKAAFAQPVLIRTAQPQMGVAQVSEQAARLSGVPVLEATELGPGHYRVVLQCTDAEACRGAAARIAADRQFALAVEADERVRIPAKPARDAAR